MQIKNHPQLLIHLLRDKPHAVGAEIGVFRGRFAVALLRNLPDIKTYYCVDPWKHNEDYIKATKGTPHGNFPIDKAYSEFLRVTNPYEEKRVILRMSSMEALFHVADESLDWVFIDGNHTYPYVRKDIIGWSPKVKPGGLIAGHDFNLKGRRDVEIAVRELIINFKVKVNTWYTWKENT